MDSEFAVSVEAAVKFAPWRTSNDRTSNDGDRLRLRLDLMAQCQLPHRRQTPADVVDEFAAGYRKIILTNPDDIPHNKRKPV